MTKTIIELRIIIIHKKMKIIHLTINLSENIAKSFTIIRIKMNIIENLKIIIIKERVNMTIKVMNKINIVNRNMEEREMFINRNIKAEDIMRSIEAREEEGFKEEVISKEVAEISTMESITEEREDMIEEVEEMEVDPINSTIQDPEILIKTHSIIIIIRINIRVNNTAIRINRISILQNKSKTKIQKKNERYLMMKNIMKSKLMSQFKNMVNIKEKINSIIMKKMIIMEMEKGKILIMMSLAMTKILLIKILGKVIMNKIKNKKRNGCLKIRILKLINRLVKILKNSINPKIQIKEIIKIQMNKGLEIKNK